jgi:glutamate synthase (NADPH/NADH) small chain
MSTTPNQDLARYAQTENVLETSRSALAELEHTDAVELFQKQLALLKKRLLSDPRSLRTTFVSDGVRAIAWEFQQEELGANFTKALWELLLRNDEMSLVLMRFIWSMPLKFKRKFVKAIDDHLSWPSPAAMMARRGRKCCFGPKRGRP